MSEEQKPVAATPATDATEVPAPTGTETAAPAVTETSATTEAAPTAGESSTAAETAAAPVAEEKKEEEPAKPAEPITSGVLSYSAPGNFLKSILGLKQKYYFWVGDEAVPTQNLNHYLAAGKPEFTHPTAAWSSQTGKGLLYFSKTAEAKEHPTGVLALSDVEDLKAVGTIEFTFKLHGKTHVFIAESEKERSGWVAGLKSAIEEAKTLKKDLHESEGFKTTAAGLGAPAAVAASAAKAESAPKKSSDSKSVERAARPEEAGKKKSSKDRSQSRGKAFLNSLRGKKEEVEQKAEAKKEDVKGDVKGEEPVAVEPTPAATSTEDTTAAATVPTETPATEEAKTEEAIKDEPKKEETKTRRSSRFFDYVKGAISPTQEKKADEAQLAPPATEAAATEGESSAPVIPAPTEAVPEPAVAEPSVGATATPEIAPAPATTEETSPVNGESKAATSPTADGKEKRRSSFFVNFRDQLKKAGERVEKKTEATKDKVESKTETSKDKEEVKPTTEGETVKPETEAAVVDETPAATEEAKAETKPEVKPETKETTKETKKESPVQKFTGLLRNPSKVIRGNKEGKKSTKTPEKVEETPATTEADKPAAPAVEPVKEAEKPAEKPTEAPTTSTGPTSIGDVVPEAVNVGSAPPTNQTVQATA